MSAKARPVMPAKAASHPDVIPAKAGIQGFG